MRKMEQIRDRVDAVVRDPATAEKLKPWYRQFCKRPCFHDEYLDTYNLPTVHLVDTAGREVRLTEDAMIVDGEAHGLDCLVFATGFEVGTTYNRRAGFDMTGRGGVSLADKWADGLKTLHGMQTHGFPNCFFLGATQSALTVNIPHTLHEQSDHIAYMLRTAGDRGATVLEATPDGERMWVEEMRSKAHLGMAFYAQCTPGYYNGEGRAGNPNGYFSAAYGGGALRYFEILEEWRAEGAMAGVELR